MVGVWPCLRMFAIGLAMLTTVMAFDPHVINRLTWLTPYMAAAEEFVHISNACVHVRNSSVACAFLRENQAGSSVKLFADGQDTIKRCSILTPKQDSELLAHTMCRTHESQLRLVL